jgi:hypothetical protein
MAEPVTLFDKTGQSLEVHPEDVSKALGQGWRMAVQMTDRTGEAREVHPDDASAALKNGWIVGQPKTSVEKAGEGFLARHQTAAGAAYGAASSSPVPLEKSGLQHLADSSTPEAATAGAFGVPAPLANLVGGLIRSHADTAQKGIANAKQVVADVTDSTTPLPQRMKNAAESLAKEEAYSLATVIPGLGPMAAHAGEAIGESPNAPDDFGKAAPFGEAAGVIGQGAIPGLGKKFYSKAVQPAAEAISRVTGDVSIVPENVNTAKPVISAKTGLIPRGAQKVVTGTRQLVDPTTLPADSAFIKSTKPANSIPRVREQVNLALPEIRRVLDDNGVDPSAVTHAQALDAALQAKRDVWSAVEKQLSPNGEYRVPANDIASAIEATKSRMSPIQKRRMPGVVDAIDSAIDDYRGKSLKLEEVENRIQELNNELRAKQVGGMRESTLRNDPNYAHQFAELDALRKIEGDAMGMLTGSGLKPLKQKYAALKTIQGILEKSKNVAERASEVPLFEGLGRMSAAGRVAKGILTVSPGEIGAGAAEYAIARKNALANNREFMLQHAISKTKASEHPLDSVSSAGGFAPPHTKQVPLRLNAPVIQARPSTLTRPALPAIKPRVGPPETNAVEAVGIPQTAEAHALQKSFEENPDAFSREIQQPGTALQAAPKRSVASIPAFRAALKGNTTKTKALPPISLFRKASVPESSRVEAVGIPQTAEAHALRNHFEKKASHPDVPNGHPVVHGTSASNVASILRDGLKAPDRIDGGIKNFDSKIYMAEGGGVAEDYAIRRVGDGGRAALVYIKPEFAAQLQKHSDKLGGRNFYTSHADIPASAISHIEEWSVKDNSLDKLIKTHTPQSQQSVPAESVESKMDRANKIAREQGSTLEDGTHGASYRAPKPRNEVVRKLLAGKKK